MTRYAEGKASDSYTKNRISEKYVQYSRLKPKCQSRATRSEENLHSERKITVTVAHKAVTMKKVSRCELKPFNQEEKCKYVTFR